MKFSIDCVCACKKVSLFLSSLFSWYQSLVKAKREDSKQRSHWKWYKGKSSIILLTPLCNPRSGSSSGSYGRNLQIGCCLHRLTGSRPILQPFGTPFGLNFCGQNFVPGAFRPPFCSCKVSQVLAWSTGNTASDLQVFEICSDYRIAYRSVCRQGWHMYC